MTVSTTPMKAPGQSGPKRQLPAKSPSADEVYAAAIAAGGEMDRNARPTPLAVRPVLRSALERRGLAVTEATSADQQDRLGALMVGGADGILIAMENDERPVDAQAAMRLHQWRRAHVLTFGARSLSIRTISA